MKLLFLSIASLLVEAQQRVASVASFQPYPGYPGNLQISGTIDISSTATSAYTFNVNLIGGEQNGNHTFHIHAGVSCAAASSVGGHFWAPFNELDPWNAPSVTIVSGNTGAISGSFDVDFGYTSDVFIGHAMVVHSSNGARVACGIIGGGNNKNNLAYPAYETTILGRYPNYTGTLGASGTIEVWDLDSARQVVNFRLVGLAPNTTGGVHIHEGKTCASSGNHFWTPQNATDPWLVTMYLANDKGQADGSFIINSGYLLADNIYHAMVIHDANKTRIACGTLGGTLVGVVSELMPYPGYTGNLMVSGRVAISYEPSHNDSKYRFAVNLAGGELSANMSFHIHAGISCADASYVGGHFWAPFNDTDPWNTPKVHSNPAGVVKDQFDLAFGYTHEEFVGHAVVIHNAAGGRVACGLIKDANATSPIYQRAVLSQYPGYNGTYNVTGAVEVRDLADTRQVVNFRLAGLPRNASGGIHIHEGTTCATSGPHFWTPATSPDPWTEKMYYSSGTGVAEGSFIISSGYLLNQNIYHAVVVHEGGPTRAACGLLGGVSPSPASSPTPTASPTAANSTSAPSAAPSADSTSAPSPAGNSSCPQATIQGVFTNCRTYDFSGTASCSSACATRLAALITAFKAQNISSVIAANQCLDAANSTQPWVNGALVALKERINFNGVALCNTTTDSISGAAAISSFVAVIMPFFLWF